MSFLSRLFQRKPHIAPVEKSMGASDINKMSAEDLASFSNDEQQSFELRAKAISLLPLGESLLNACKPSTQPPLQLAAFKRLACLLDDKTLSVDNLLSSINNMSICLSISAYCQQDDTLNLLMANYSSQESLAELVFQSSSSKTRQAAMQRISDEALLHNIQKTLKNKDKTVYKIAKEKLEKLRDEHRQQDILLTQLSTICEKLERLANTIDEKSFADQLEKLQQQWLTVKNQCNSDTLDEQFNTANHACQQRLDTMLAVDAEKQAHILAIEASKQAYIDLISELQNAITALYALTAIPEDLTLSQQKNIQALQEKWQQASSIQAASKQQQTQWQQLQITSHTLTELLLTHGTLPDLLVTLDQLEDDSEKKILQSNINKIIRCSNTLPSNAYPSALIQAKESMAVFIAAFNQQEQLSQDAVRHIASLINKSLHAAEQGNLRHAVGIRQSIERKQAEVTDLPARLNEKLTDLDAAVNKLQDYRNFATEPKKLQLIETMQVLAKKAESYAQANTIENNEPNAAIKFDAIDQADQIKKCQSDWKELVYGGKDTQPELWEKFHALAQIAYTPCKAHFNDKSAERKENLEKRQQLVIELEAYNEKNDWALANWKSVEEIVRTAKTQWSGYFPIDRSANAPVEKKFRHAIDNIQAHIDAAYETEKLAKQAVVDQSKLLDALPNSEAIDKVKQLQSQWKNTGRTWQRVERALWKEFKTLSDAVFDKKQAETESFKLELTHNAELANAVCEKIEALSQEPPATLNNHEGLKALKEEFYTIGNLPHKAKQGIQSRFNHALDVISTAIEQSQLNEAKKSWLDVLDIKEKINQLKCLQLTDKDSTSLHSEITANMSDVVKWPASSKAAIEASLNASTADISLSEHAKSMHLQCIHAEITLDKPSPEEDKALRMEYQMSRLQASLSGSSGAKNEKDTLHDLYITWLNSPVVETEIYTTFATRLLSLLS